MEKQPIVTAGAILGLVQAALVMGVSMGWLNLSGEQTTNILAFVAAMLALALPIATAFYAKRFVTPLAEPKDEDGVALVRKADMAPTKAQARAASRRFTI